MRSTVLAVALRDRRTAGSITGPDRIRCRRRGGSAIPAVMLTRPLSRNHVARELPGHNYCRSAETDTSAADRVRSPTDKSVSVSLRTVGARMWGLFLCCDDSILTLLFHDRVECLISHIMFPARYFSPTAVGTCETIAVTIVHRLAWRLPGAAVGSRQNRIPQAAHAELTGRPRVRFAYIDSAILPIPASCRPTNPSGKSPEYWPRHRRSADCRQRLCPAGTPAETGRSFSAVALFAGDIAFARIPTIQDSSILFGSSSSGKRY